MRLGGEAVRHDQRRPRRQRQIRRLRDRSPQGETDSMLTLRNTVGQKHYKNIWGENIFYDVSQKCALKLTADLSQKSSIEFPQAISDTVGFKFKLYTVPDHLYGFYDHDNEGWNGKILSFDLFIRRFFQG